MSGELYSDASVDTARVYLVSSRKTYEGIRKQARSLSSRRDSTGAELVISEADSRQLPQAVDYVHRHERRCGGFFAFPSRAAAEAFVRSERSAQAIAAAQISYTLDNQPTVDRWLPRVDEKNIYATIAHLSGYRNRFFSSATGKSSAEWIRDSWQDLAADRTDVTTELFTDCSNCSTQPSVILTIRGTTLPDEVVVLGAHLDSININGGGNTQLAPGADDDASGIAVLTEALRIAIADGWRPQRTVKVMGYAAEEMGLRGSNAIAQSFKQAGTKVVAVLQMDMTNYKSGNTNDMKLISDFSNSALQGFFRTLFDTYLVPMGYTRGSYTCGYACSDHGSWTAAGYPAAMMFEAGDASGPFSLIHTPSDTLASMDDSARNSVKFAQFSLAFMAETAKTTAPKMSAPLPPVRRP